MNGQECYVCVEKYTKTKRAKIECPFCHYLACRECCETYILSEPIIKCMSCKKEWTRKFVRDHFTQVFMKTRLREHDRNLLFDRERSFMPETQQYVEQEIQKERIEEDIMKLQQQIISLRVEITKKYQEMNSITYGRSFQKSNKSTLKYIASCSKCKGFLNEKWDCGICGFKACKECHEEIVADQEHVCNPESVATAKLLMSDTKPCPSCHTLIFKISGCDQMWCTQCRTAFSWRTGEKEETIHNPHYYEWLFQRNNDANHVNVDCRGRLTQRMIDVIHNRTYIIRTATHVLTEKEITHAKNLEWLLFEFIQGAIHIQNWELEKFHITNDHIENENRRMRIDYMRNKIEEQIYKDTLEKQDRKAKKYREYRQILEMYVNVINDILNRLIEDLNGQENHRPSIKEIIRFMEQSTQEFTGIREYTNQCLEDVAKTFMTTRYQINAEGKFQPTLHTVAT